MAKFLNSIICFFLILSVALAINQVNAEKECTEILHPNPGSIFGCVLRDCNKECKEKHNGTGYCTSDAGVGKYVCTCAYDCSLP
ncbi:putative defensin-like protein [Capsicum annuum]|uniref:putative defensin-like protein 157 n=1 Tax=Capsicum annuum TaxID=4072 RepID=UPI001FB10086|nr:putative defensin-like protein 157 [Capsicum annuum]